MRLRRALRRGLARSVYWSGAYRLNRRNAGLVILRYHSVSRDPAKAAEYVSPAVVVPTRQFAEHMEFLRARFECVDLAEGLRRLYDPARRPTRPQAAVTFDDGYADNHVDAWPILKRLSIPASIYLVSDVYVRARALWNVRLRLMFARAADSGRSHVSLPGGASCRPADSQCREAAMRVLTRRLNGLDALGRESALHEVATQLGVAVEGGTDRMLSPTQIGEMAEGCVTFGSHTMTHPNLALIAVEEATREIRESKVELERSLRLDIQAFAFPNPGSSRPHVTWSLAKSVRSAGYGAGLTSEPGIATPGSASERLPRVGIGRNVASLPDFLWKVQHSQPVRHERTPDMARDFVDHVV